MLTNPKKLSIVQVWYRESMAGFMPFHGRLGRVLAAGKGKPRNHVLEIDGQAVVFPCGNLRKAPKGRWAVYNQ